MKNRECRRRRKQAQRRRKDEARRSAWGGLRRTSILVLRIYQAGVGDEECVDRGDVVVGGGDPDVVRRHFCGVVVAGDAKFRVVGQDGQ